MDGAFFLEHPYREGYECLGARKVSHDYSAGFLTFRVPVVGVYRFHVLQSVEFHVLFQIGKGNRILLYCYHLLGVPRDAESEVADAREHVYHDIIRFHKCGDALPFMMVSLGEHNLRGVQPVFYTVFHNNGFRSGPRYFFDGWLAKLPAHATDFADSLYSRKHRHYSVRRFLLFFFRHARHFREEDVPQYLIRARQSVYGDAGFLGQGVFE